MSNENKQSKARAERRALRYVHTVVGMYSMYVEVEVGST